MRLGRRSTDSSSFSNMLLKRKLQVQLSKTSFPTLIWVKDAPKLGYAHEADVKAFIDKYISCSLPDNDEEL